MRRGRNGVPRGRDDYTNAWEDSEVKELKFDRDAVGRLAKALAFICGPDNPTTVALQAASASGSERDVAKARKLFLSLKLGDRRAALTMLADWLALWRVVSIALSSCTRLGGSPSSTPFFWTVKLWPHRGGSRTRWQAYRLEGIHGEYIFTLRFFT
jgi:hypothetical protein